MSRLDHAAHIVRELGDSMGMSGLSLDEANSVSLAFDDMPLTLAYRAEPLEVLWLMADLGEVPEGTDGRDMLKALLQAGFVSWATNCMTVAMDESGRRAIGFTAIPITHLRVEVLHQVLGALVETALPMRAEILAGTPTAGGSDDPPPRPDSGMLRV